jgi:hypothetical protein
VGIYGGNLWRFSGMTMRIFLSGYILPKNKGVLGKKNGQREQPPQFMGYIKVCDWTAILGMLKNGFKKIYPPSSNVAGETLEQNEGARSSDDHRTEGFCIAMFDYRMDAVLVGNYCKI